MLELYIVMNYSMTSLGQPELLIAKVNTMRRNCPNYRNPHDSDTDNRNYINSQVDRPNQRQQGTSSAVVLREEANFWRNHLWPGRADDEV